MRLNRENQKFAHHHFCSKKRNNQSGKKNVKPISLTCRSVIPRPISPPTLRRLPLPSSIYVDDGTLPARSRHPSLPQLELGLNEADHTWVELAPAPFEFRNIHNFLSSLDLLSGPFLSAPPPSLSSRSSASVSAFVGVFFRVVLTGIPVVCIR